MRYVYPCVLHAEEGGGYWVSFPDVKGANTGGSTREEALGMAEDALVAALGAYYHLGEDIPLPSPVAEGQEPVPLRPIAAAKVALNVAMRDQGVTKVALAQRLGVSEAAVRKLCNPRPSLPHQHRPESAPCRRSWAHNRRRALAPAASRPDING